MISAPSLLLTLALFILGMLLMYIVPVLCVPCVSIDAGVCTAALFSGNIFSG